MKSYSLWKRLHSEKGTSSIEFAFYLLIFALMCGFLIDMSFSLITKSHMERVNYSLTMIFRERNGLFGGGNASDISKSDFDTLKATLDEMLRHNDGSVEPYQLGIQILQPIAQQCSIQSSIQSSPLNNCPSPHPVKPDGPLSRYTSASFNTMFIEGCDVRRKYSRREDLAKLSVWGHRPDRSPDADQDWFPVYEVILCVPGAESYFNRALGIFNKDLGSLYIRNVALPR
ncbi:TPA: tight adherence pilus pseudopilin TadF [Citrobacter amalonaticus]|nr:tight adherence pilus pseudopilin TadF [Citrobacter amalonaticus]EKW3840525.1 hypothetical protein [Citrobacter amalonaticus]EKX8497343.1 hypothetical protein [Citrobacter amalonaticus]ELO0859288.1 hypothetical protein [Citrobacter amalonaticus]MDV0785728.1 tight adherence pilus pseudopilin TadF [Citrobacter amalonaticus]MEB0641791.1 tight adherence pilus pseudopilin TadF [Citrobacter amalonaticus]